MPRPPPPPPPPLFHFLASYFSWSFDLEPRPQGNELHFWVWCVVMGVAWVWSKCPPLPHFKSASYPHSQNPSSQYLALLLHCYVLLYGGTSSDNNIRMEDSDKGTTSTIRSCYHNRCHDQCRKQSINCCHFIACYLSVRS